MINMDKNLLGRERGFNNLSRWWLIGFGRFFFLEPAWW